MPGDGFLLKIKGLVPIVFLFAELSGARLSAQIRRVITFREGAQNGAFCGAKGGIVFEKDGEIWIARGSANDRCLTCAGTHLAKHADRFPACDATGEWLVFATGENIRVMGVASRNVSQTVAASKAANLRFSRHGDRLAWDQQGNGGRDAVIASWSHGGIASARSLPLPPAVRLDAVDDFSGDGRRLFITASDGRSDARETSILECETVRPACVVTAAQPHQRVDFARLTPSGSKLIYASTGGGWLAEDARDFKSDLWLAPVDANERAVRMTWFNEPANPKYIDHGARIKRTDWDGTGRWLLATVIRSARGNQTALVKIEFPEPE